MHGDLSPNLHTPECNLLITEFHQCHAEVRRKFPQGLAEIKGDRKLRVCPSDYRHSGKRVLRQTKRRVLNFVGWPASVLHKLDHKIHSIDSSWPAVALEEDTNRDETDVGEAEPADLDAMEAELKQLLNEQNIAMICKTFKNVFLPCSQSGRNKATLVADVLAVPVEGSQVTIKDHSRYARNGKETLVTYIQEKIPEFTGIRRPLMGRYQWYQYLKRSVEWLVAKKKDEESNQHIHFEFSMIRRKVMEKQMTRNELVLADSEVKRLGLDPMGYLFDTKTLLDEIKKQLTEEEEDDEEDGEEDDQDDEDDN